MEHFNSTNQFAEDTNSFIEQSKERMKKQLEDGSFKEHVITNSAVSFSDKENSYLEGFLCFLKTKNYLSILECK